MALSLIHISRTYEPFLLCAVVYFVLTFTTTRLLRLIEKKMDGPDSYTCLLYTSRCV